MDYKITLGILSIVIAVISYIPYFRDIFSGKTKPHAFSWFVWSVLTGIAFAAQIVKHGGPGAWVTGLTALACLIISLLALYKGEKDFPLFDWTCLFLAFVALALWWFTKDPTGSVILITITDAIAFIPTFRKCYYKPHEETISTYILSIVKFVLGIFALSTFIFATWFFPVAITLMNTIFVAMVLIRRRAIKK